MRLTWVMASLFLLVGSAGGCELVVGDGGWTVGSEDAGSSGSSSGSSCTSVSFVAGSISARQVALGASVRVSCDYGAEPVNSPTIKASLGGTMCPWDYWNGASAVFTCAAPSTAGTYTVTCMLEDLSPTDFCPMEDDAGTLVVSP